MFTGEPSVLADIARGQVWISQQRDSRGSVTWRLAPDRYRHVGGAPDEADTLNPTIEDGYLLLVGDDAAVDKDQAA